jgi:hypothetical protein
MADKPTDPQRIIIEECESINNRQGGIYLGPGTTGVRMTNNKFVLPPGTFGIMDEGHGNVSRGNVFITSQQGQPDKEPPKGKLRGLVQGFSFSKDDHKKK